MHNHFNKIVVAEPNISSNLHTKNFHYGALGANTLVPMAKVQMTVWQSNFDFPLLPPFMPQLLSLIQEGARSNPKAAKNCKRKSLLKIMFLQIVHFFKMQTEADPSSPSWHQKRGREKRLWQAKNFGLIFFEVLLYRSMKFRLLDWSLNSSEETCVRE